jgi:hypothetical protein
MVDSSANTWIDLFLRRPVTVTNEQEQHQTNSTYRNYYEIGRKLASIIWLYSICEFDRIYGSLFSLIPFRCLGRD